jgi:hypothetical protein
LAEASERLNVIADFAENEKPLGHTVWFFAPLVSVDEKMPRPRALAVSRIAKRRFACVAAAGSG